MGIFVGGEGEFPYNGRELASMEAKYVEKGNLKQ